MKLERKRNALHNIEVGILNKIITILCPFVLRTVLIYTLGSQYLGLSSLFTSVLQVLSLSEFGIGSAMVFSLYQPIAEDDTNRIRELLSLYKVIYKTIGLVILVGGFIVLPFLPKLIHGSYPADMNIYVLYILYLFNSSESYFISAYKSTVLSAYQRKDIILGIGLAAHILLYLIQFICLINFKNYYTYVIWIPIFTVLENIATAIYVNKNYSECVKPSSYSMNNLKSIFQQVKDLFGHKLSQVVTNSVDTIVISSFLGLQMVTIYNNYYYLMSAVSGILDIFYQAVLAGIGNSMFSETKEKNRKDFDRFIILNSWVVGWCSICFLCLYQPMINIWMGKELMLAFDTVILLSIYFYVWKIRQSVLLYKDAAGMWTIDKWKPYVEIAVNLILNIVLVRIIGINGVVISTIVSMLFISIPWESIVFIKKYFNESAAGYFKLIAKYLLFTIVAGIITFFICRNIKGYGIIGTFLVKSVICCIFPNIIIFLMGVSQKSHCDAITFAISLLPIKKQQK